MRAVSQSIGVQQQDEDGLVEIYAAIGDDTLSGQSLTSSETTGSRDRANIGAPSA